MLVRKLSSLALLAFAGVASAQVSFGNPEPLVGARSLALSPDGTKIAFTYRGDVWVASSQGGRAIPITNHIEMDDNPVWSPDGNHIAFASNRFGNWDIFVVPAEGGKTQRLTYWTGTDIPRDWTPDGNILTTGRREEGYWGVYKINVATGRSERIFIDTSNLNYPHLSPDGKTIVYSRIGFPEGRPRYEGTAAFQLWEYDLASGKRREIRNNRFQHLWPSYAGANEIAMVTVTEKTPSSSPLGKSIPKNVDNAKRTPNVYVVENGRTRQVTQFVGGAVRYLTTSKSGDMAFERDGQVSFMAKGGAPKPVTFFASIDDKTTQEERLVLSDSVQSQSLNAKNELFIFAVRNEIWSVPVKQPKGPNGKDATQLTKWAGLDNSPIFDPNGEQFYFLSDRDGAMALYRQPISGSNATRITNLNEDISDVELTPDKKGLAYVATGPNAGLYVYDLASRITKSVWPARNISNYSFSPDMQWIAASRTISDVGNIYIKPINGREPINVTKRNVNQGAPNWSCDGKFLYYRLSSGGGFRGTTGAGSLNIVPLQADSARNPDLEMKFEKPAGIPKVEIDFDGITDRIRRLNGQPHDSFIFSDKQSGTLYYRSGGDLWSSSYDGETVRRITSGGDVGDWSVSNDENVFSLVKGGQLHTFEFRKPNAQPSMVGFRAEWHHDLRAERAAAFQEFYRVYNGRFYDANFHGRDWKAIRDRYEPLLDSVGHRNEMAILLNFMVGELESSHSEVGPAGGNPGSDTTAHLGFSYDTSFGGPGLKVLDVPAKTPGSYAKTKINVGDVVLEVNGKPVTANEALYRDVLNGQTGRDLTLLVSKSGNRADARTVTYRAMSTGEYNALLFSNLLEWRRNYVAQKSGGKLAYVYIAGMGQGNLTTFNEEAYDAVQGKSAVIIDVRGNGGGNISDRLIDQIERIPNSWFVPRDGDPELAPTLAWDMPTVVMAAENSFSNAEMFPYAMRQRRLAKVVGNETPGYVIWTFGGSLVDGTSIRIPFGGSYRMDGTNQENIGEKPDYTVMFTPEQFFAGKDPQLDKAIEVALSQIKK